MSGKYAAVSAEPVMVSTLPSLALRKRCAVSIPVSSSKSKLADGLSQNSADSSLAVAAVGMARKEATNSAADVLYIYCSRIDLEIAWKEGEDQDCRYVATFG